MAFSMGYCIMSRDSAQKQDEIRTSSRLRAWWLSKFKGYRIKLVIKKSPKPGILGGVKYESVWVLAPQRIEWG